MVNSYLEKFKQGIARDKYYKLTKFPDILFQRWSFYESTLKIDKTIAKVAMNNSLVSLRKGIKDWFKSEGFSIEDFELSKRFKENTLDHEDISSGHLRCEGTIEINNTKLFLKKAKVTEEIASQITSRIEIESTWNRLNINFTSKLDNEGHKKVMESIKNYVETPISFKMGEGLELSFYKNMAKILKNSSSESLKSLVVKVPQFKAVEFLKSNSNEYHAFVSQVDNLWLTRKLNQSLKIEETKSTNRSSLKI